MTYNLGNLSKEEKDKINVDKAAAAVVYAERHDMSDKFKIHEIERDFNEETKKHFRERLEYYRSK